MKSNNSNTGTVKGGEGLHTKGEWITANKIGSGSSLRIYCTDNVQRTHIADCFSFSVGISDVEAEANANRIVNCVNNFDSLVSALRDIVEDDKKKGILKAQHRVNAKKVLNNINQL